jgi:hypothetical protein
MDEQGQNETSTQPAETEAAEQTATAEPTVGHRDFGEWHGRELLDSEGHAIGKLQDVYFDIETEQAQFATVKEGGLLVKRHLTFVPLAGVTIGPDNLQVAVTKAQIKDAPKMGMEGDELTQDDESSLYHYYHLNYTPSETPSGRRLARR